MTRTSSIRTTRRHPSNRRPAPTEGLHGNGALALAGRFRTPLILAGLTLLTAIAFAGVCQAGFINFDDNQYVTANGLVQQGLTLNGIKWAFTHEFLKIWHPLSQISFMADFSLFGLSPLGYHLENLLIHILNVWLVFLILSRATGSALRSGGVAAVFAVHPMRVESVAWVSERKDVLAMLFGLLALMAYVHYARKPSVWRYLPILPAIALSLLAKPMFVTLPAVFLLMDIWPLARVGPAWQGDTAHRWRQIGRLIGEKIPAALVVLVFFVLLKHFVPPPPAAGHHSDTLWQTATQRTDNAYVSYVRYIAKTVVPWPLATPYPLNADWGRGTITASIAGLLLVTALCLWQARRRPWLLVGWLWFAGTLFPTIGVVSQIAFQAMADRYSYFPSIGLLIMAGWSIPDLSGRSSRVRGAAAGVGAAVLASLTGLTIVQVGYWKDSIALFTHAAAVTERNDFAWYSLGNAYFQEAGDAARSIKAYREALRLRPDLASAHDNLGFVLSRTGRVPEAIEQFEAAVRIDPGCEECFNNIGAVLVAAGRLPEAAARFRSALAVNSHYRDARLNLAFALMKDQKWGDALEALTPLIGPNSTDIPALLAGGRASFSAGNFQAAEAYYGRVVDLQPESFDARYGLGSALAMQGRTDAAINELRIAVSLRPGDPSARQTLNQMLRPNGRGRS